MVEPKRPGLSVERQCELLSISRSGFYYEPTGESPFNLTLMREIDETFMECPFYGSRQMTRHLCRLGHVVGRKRVARLMALMGLSPIYQKPNTSAPHPSHTVYKYLLGKLEITRPNHVWCTDITYIAMPRGFLYLVAVMDWATRKVLAWRLSNTMEVDFCVEALEEAIAHFGTPEIFNSDQGSQFTCPRFTSVLLEAGVRISMDGRGRWMDNVFIESSCPCCSSNFIEWREGVAARRSSGRPGARFRPRRPRPAGCSAPPSSPAAPADLPDRASG